MEILRDIKVILTDWDDTHVATFHTVANLIERFAEQYGLPKPGIDGVSASWGKPTPLLIACLWPDIDPEEVYKLYKAFIPVDWDTPPFPGIEDTITSLVKSGFKVGIVSSNSSRWIRQSLEKHLPKIKDLYFFIHGAEECPNHKPNPHVFDPAMSILGEIGIKEAQTLYIGDSVIDYFAAKNRDMFFVATLTGNSTRDEFLREGLSEVLIIDHFEQLPSLLTK